MNCEEFIELSEIDKAVYMASLIHVCQSDTAIFKNGKDLIALGKRKGLFDGIKIMPDHLQAEERGILTDVIINTDTNETT